MNSHLVIAAMLLVGRNASAENIVFTPDFGVVDVKATCGAKGDAVP